MPQPACQSSSDGLSDLKSPAFNCCILFLPEVSIFSLPAGKPHTFHIVQLKSIPLEGFLVVTGPPTSSSSHRWPYGHQSPQVNVSSSLLNSELRDSHVTWQQLHISTVGLTKCLLFSINNVHKKIKKKKHTHTQDTISCRGWFWC